MQSFWVIFRWKEYIPIIIGVSLFADSCRFEETLYADWGQSFSISREIVREVTEHQDLAIFENKLFGRVMALDGVIQLTEADEPIYHEMIVHVPLFSHDDPRSILIIGGGGTEEFCAKC